MPATSKAQRRLMAMALSVKREESSIDDFDVDSDTKKSIQNLADTMSEKDLRKYAKTKEDDLPDKVMEISTLQDIEDICSFLLHKGRKSRVESTKLLNSYGMSSINDIGELSDILRVKFEVDLRTLAGKLDINLYESNVATLTSTPGMGPVVAPTLDGVVGSGDVMGDSVFNTNDVDDDEYQTPFCNPKRDKNCSKFRYLKSFEDWVRANKESDGDIFNSSVGQSLTEGKQVGILYHYTKYENLINILHTDTLIAGKHNGVNRKYVSFTRNKNFHLSNGSIPTHVRLVIDGDKLSNRYKIEPFTDDDSIYGYDVRLPDEMEERIRLKEVKKISNYILRIDIDTTTLAYKHHTLEHGDLIKTIKGVWRIPINDNYRRDEVYKGKY